MHSLGMKVPRLGFFTSMNPKTTILIDGNSVGYAMHYGTKLTAGGIQTQAVFGFVKAMREIRVGRPHATPLVLWDGRAQWRFDLNPDYKSNRDDDPKKVAIKQAYTEQKPYIQAALQHLGIRQMQAATHEADDMAGYLTPMLAEKPDTEIELLSGDHDWIQLVRSNVVWRDHRNETNVITLGNLYDKTGYKTPLAFLEGKCLQGDSSDVISGVGGIGEKGAPEFLAEFGSVRNFWAKCDSGEFVPKKKAHIKLASPEGRAIFGRNLRLMQLMKVPKPAKEAITLTPGKFDKDKFADVCGELAFASILKNLDVFTKPFEN